MSARFGSSLFFFFSLSFAVFGLFLHSLLFFFVTEHGTADERLNDFQSVRASCQTDKIGTHSSLNVVNQKMVVAELFSVNVRPRSALH